MDLILKNITGVNEAQDPESIKESEVAVLKNLVLNKSIGKPTKRGGLSVFNSNAGTTYSLHDILDSAGANYVVGQIGTNFSKSLDGTGAWSAVKGSLTSNAKTRLQTYNNFHYVTNGTDAPFVIGGATLANTYTYNITRPDVSGITSTNGTSVALTVNAKYYWCMVYVTSTGDYSNPSAPFTHFASTGYFTTTSTYRSVNFANLPVSADTRVVSRLIYRTKANSNVFYLCARLDNTTTTWSDFFPDTNLDLSETVTLTQTISTAKYITAYQERLFWGNVSLYDFSPDMVYGTVSSMSAANGYSFRAVAGLGGSLSAGTYIYRIVFVDKTGKVSGYRATTAISVGSSGKVTFSNCPFPLEAEYEVRLYRSIDGGAYYYLPVDPRDDSDDGTIAATAETMPAQTTSTTTFVSAVVYSEIGKPSQINAINITQVLPDNGDEITGLLPVQDGILVFKRNSIAQIFILGNPLNWKVQTVTTQIGCDNANSIQKIGNRIYFMSNKQVFRFPDKINIPVSLPKKTTLATISTLYDSTYSNYYQWYMIACTVTGGAHKIIIYDEVLDTWYEFENAGLIYNYSITEKTLGTTKGTILIGGTLLTKYNESSTVDNAIVGLDIEIVPVITSKTFTINEPNSLVRPRILYIDYKKKDAQTATFTIANPQDNTASLTSSDTTDSTISSDYKNYTVVTNAMSGTMNTCNKLNMTFTGAGLAELNGVKLKYRVINRGKREL